MPVPRFGLNRFDARSVAAFAEDAKRAESLGWDAIFQPDSQLRRRDTYVLLAAAANVTERVHLGPFIANPVNRHPTVTASSIATIDELAPGRTILTLGAGDTAVRLAGLRPARVDQLKDATQSITWLLAGEALDVGTERRARLPHFRPVPVWIAAGGPKTLRMAGSAADGVFIRAGTAAANIERAVQLIHEGALQAGRKPESVKLGLVCHTVLVDDPAVALAMAKSMAAGYYEYTPSLFETAGIEWQGPPPEQLKREHNVWPDFHHNRFLAASGQAVDFLPREAADKFNLWGSADQICEQLIEVLQSAPASFEYVVLQPIPDPTWLADSAAPDYTARVAAEVLPRVRDALGD